MSELYKQGLTHGQAHKGIPEGLYEEEQGHKGFFGPVSHLLRKSPSTRWLDIQGPLRPHMFDLVQLEPLGTKRLLYNSQVTISMEFHDAHRDQELVSHRNADGDLLLFCHSGEGEILSEYGWFLYRAGHYIVIPKCLGYTVVPQTKSVFFAVENRTSHYEQPDRGLVGRHAIYDPQNLTKPNLERLHERLAQLGEVRKIKVKSGDLWTTFFYDTCIYNDVMGWKGDLYPYTLHVDDMMPLMSHRAHLPPSAHTTFVARDFVICTFLPRPLESDADALKVPFYHQNIDFDEVLFYHAGDFFSRDNLHPGMMSLHPAGFPHGPHPKATKGINQKTHTNEYAVMVDTRYPLKIDPNAEQVALKEYWKSWQTEAK